MILPIVEVHTSIRCQHRRSPVIITAPERFSFIPRNDRNATKRSWIRHSIVRVVYRTVSTWKFQLLAGIFRSTATWISPVQHWHFGIGEKFRTAVFWMVPPESLFINAHRSKWSFPQLLQIAPYRGTANAIISVHQDCWNHIKVLILHLKAFRPWTIVFANFVR